MAKALRDFAKTNENLVVKGGVLGDKLLTAAEAKALADVAPREELLARLAGAMAAPMQQFAGLLQAVPRSFAYGLAALIEQGGAPGARVDEPAEAPAAEAPEAEASAPEATEAPEASADDAPEASAEAPADAPVEAPADAAESETETETDAVADAADTPTEES